MYYWLQIKPLSFQASYLVQYSLILLIFLGFILGDTQEKKDKICLSVICFSCTSLNWLCINQHNADISSPLPVICTGISRKITTKLLEAINKTVFFCVFLDALDDTAFKAVLINFKKFPYVNGRYSCFSSFLFFDVCVNQQK